MRFDIIGRDAAPRQSGGVDAISAISANDWYAGVDRIANNAQPPSSDRRACRGQAGLPVQRDETRRRFSRPLSRVNYSQLRREAL